MAGQDFGICISQIPMPSRLLAKDIPGLGSPTYVLIRKYVGHLPLCQQAQIFAREGFDRDYSTLKRWVCKTAAVLAPLAQAIKRHVLFGKAFFANDRLVRLLAPGSGKPKTA